MGMLPKIWEENVAKTAIVLRWPRNKLMCEDAYQAATLQTKEYFSSGSVVRSRFEVYPRKPQNRDQKNDVHLGPCWQSLFPVWTFFPKNNHNQTDKESIESLFLLNIASWATNKKWLFRLWKIVMALNENIFRDGYSPWVAKCFVQCLQFPHLYPQNESTKDLLLLLSKKNTHSTKVHLQLTTATYVKKKNLLACWNCPS